MVPEFLGSRAESDRRDLISSVNKRPREWGRLPPGVYEQRDASGAPGREKEAFAEVFCCLGEGGKENEKQS